MEILLEPTSNKLLVGDLCNSIRIKLVTSGKKRRRDSTRMFQFNTTARNPIKEILLKLNLPDHKTILMDSKEYIKMDMEQQSIKLISYKVLKLKNIKKDGYIRFQYLEQYEHVDPEVTRSQEGKRSQDDDKRLCLVDDLKKFKITFMSSQRYKSKPEVYNHHINSQVKD
ncbi:hypothetical protein Tco_1384579 [Tanacetum coccineum]